MIVFAAVMLGIFGLVLTGGYSSLLLWMHRMRKLSDVIGTVVARDRQFTGRSYWTYPVVEYTTRDGTQIRRTFPQLAQARIGRKLRIVYDPSTPDGLRPSTSTRQSFMSRGPMIYSVQLLAFCWLAIAAGLGMLAGCVAIAVAGG